jgi:hypothetical protein
MNHPPQPCAELDELLDRLTAGTLDESGHLRLDELVIGDLAMRRRYIERTFLMAELRYRLAPTVALTVVPIVPPAFDREPLPPQRPRALRRYAPTFARRRTLAWSVAGCATAFVAYVAMISWGMLDRKARDLRLEARGEGGPQASIRESQATASQPAYVVASENAAWQGASAIRLTNGSTHGVRSGEPLELASGVVKLKLKQGVTLLVEGPAEWTINGKNRATLKHGKLLASVPQRAIGFAVITPSVTVVDLGTEFGVTVDERGATRTRVFKGEVHLRAATAMGSIEELSSQRLKAGQAVHVDTKGSITPVQSEFATAEEFIKRPNSKALQTEPATLESSHPYSRAVLATPGLVAYWRLGEDGTQGSRDEVQASNDKPLGRSGGLYNKFYQSDFRQPGALGTNPTRKRGATNTDPTRERDKDGASNDNSAVHFNGESYIEVNDHPSLSGDWDGVTLVAWIKPDRQQPDSNSPVSLIVGKWAFEVTGDAYGLFCDSGKLRISVGNGIGGESGLLGAGNVLITRDAYHFAVGTWEKKTGEYRLYVDGQADQAQGRQVAPWKVNPKSYVPVLIGGQRADNSRYFAGSIDEVSIFNRALTAEEVEQLYRLATAKSENEEGKVHGTKQGKPSTVP